MVLVGVLVIASWLPFRLDLPFRAEDIRPAQDGVWSFSGRELASSPRPPPWLGEAIEGSLLEISLEVRSASAQQDGPARILSLSRDAQNQNLMIGQECADLVARVRRPGSDDMGKPALRVADVFAKPAWRSVQVHIDERRVEVAVDAVTEASDEVRGILRNWDEGYRLSLGNEHGFGRGWNGAIRVASARTLAGTTNLLAMELRTDWDDQWVWPERLSEQPSRPAVARLFAWALHLSVSVTIVIATARAWPRLSLRRLALAWLVVVVVLNVGKVAIEMRHPSVLTALIQLLGGALGLVCLTNVERPTTPSLPPSASE